MNNRWEGEGEGVGKDKRTREDWITDMNLFQDIYSTVIVIVMEPYLSIVDLSSFNEVCSYAIIRLSVKLINSLW